MSFKKIMIRILGESWKTTLLGMAAAAAQAGGSYILTTVVPMDDSAKLKVWAIGGLSAIATAVKGYYTQDKNKTQPKV